MLVELLYPSSLEYILFLYVTDWLIYLVIHISDSRTPLPSSRGPSQDTNPGCFCKVAGNWYVFGHHFANWQGLRFFCFDFHCQICQGGFGRFWRFWRVYHSLELWPGYFTITILVSITKHFFYVFKWYLEGEEGNLLYLLSAVSLLGTPSLRKTQSNLDFSMLCQTLYKV